MEQRFRLRRGRATFLLWPLVRGEQYAVVDDVSVRIRLGLLGNAEIPLRQIRGLSRIDWPWWAGLGVRFGRKMVAFTTSGGGLAMVELHEGISVRTPLPWTTPRIGVSVEDVEGFLRAVSHAMGNAVTALPADVES